MEMFILKDSKYVYEYVRYVCNYFYKRINVCKCFVKRFWDYIDFNMFLMSYIFVLFFLNLKVICVSL